MSVAAVVVVRSEAEKLPKDSLKEKNGFLFN